MQDNPGSSLAQRHPIPISPKASAIVSNTLWWWMNGAVRTAERDRAPVCLIQKGKKRGTGGGDASHHFQSSSQLHRAGVLISRAGRGCTQGQPGTRGNKRGAVPADYLLGALTVLQTEEKGTVSPEELAKCWKLPSAASIEDLPPTLPLIHRTGRGRESSPAAAVDWATKARWFN